MERRVEFPGDGGIVDTTGERGESGASGNAVFGEKSGQSACESVALDAGAAREKRDAKRRIALLARASRGDEAALDEVMRENAPLVYKIARSFAGRGCEFEDLCQIGSIGMLKAVRSFDPALGYAFSTYAVPLIVGEIRRFLRDDGTVKVSRRLKQNAASALRARERYIAEHGVEPHVSELAEICSLSAEDVTEALCAASPVRSLAEPIGTEEDLLLENVIAGEDEIAAETERLALGEALCTLEPMHRRIVTLRYYRNMSQKETAAALGLTQVKISREEKKIFAKLRKELCV